MPGWPFAWGWSGSMTFATDFADQAVLLPILALVAVLLGAQRQWRVMTAWVVSISGVCAVVLVLKIAFYSCGWAWPALDADAADLRSPSGHTAASAVVYASLLVLLLPGTRRAAILTASIGSASVAAAIGATRIGLAAHSLSEVVVGAAIGITGALAFALLAGGRIPRSTGRPILVASLVAAILLHGRHLPAEAAIQGHGTVILRTIVAACDPRWAAAIDGRPALARHDAMPASESTSRPF